MDWGKLGIFAGGVLLGTAGVDILASKDAKKVYTHCTAAALRGKEKVVDRAMIIQENAADIYEAAKQLNKERAELEAEAEICDAEECDEDEENEDEEE